MANSVVAFFERLTAAEGAFNESKVGTLGALDAVYLNVRPEVARMGQTIRVYFPDLSAFSDQAANDWNPDDLTPGFIDVPFGQRPGKALIVRDFEQFQTSTDILDKFLDPLFKRGMEYCNGAIFSTLTAGNFPLTQQGFGPTGVYASYPPLACSAGQFQIGDARLAWNLLVANKVPITGPADASILYHPDVHANTLVDTNWYQESLVSAVIAQGTRQQVAEPGSSANVAFNFNRRFDQQAPTAQTANLTGTITVAAGSAAVVGASTTFTSQAPVGSWITPGTDTVAYPVKAVADDTHLTLGMNYSGILTSGLTYTRRTYTGIAMHRYAIALAVRPLESVNTGGVTSRIVMLRGIPFRVMLSYPHIKAGWMVSADVGMVVKVLRPDFGVLFNS